MEYLKRYWIVATIVFATFVLVVGGLVEKFYIDPSLMKSEKDVRIESIMETDEFKQKAHDEAERAYYKQLLDEAKVRLDELDGKGFKEQAYKSAALVAYLKSKNATALVPYADKIVTLPRWVDVVAIVSHETSFCTRGVGKKQKNCGAVKNAKGDFKKYASVMDALEDVSMLLQNPRYANKTIAEMNGTYCVDELNDGNKCSGWTESIELAVEDIKTHVYGG